MRAAELRENARRARATRRPACDSTRTSSSRKNSPPPLVLVAKCPRPTGAVERTLRRVEARLYRAARSCKLRMKQARARRASTSESVNLRRDERGAEVADAAPPDRASVSSVFRKSRSVDAARLRSAGASPKRTPVRTATPQGEGEDAVVQPHVLKTSRMSRRRPRPCRSFESPASREQKSERAAEARRARTLSVDQLTHEPPCASRRRAVTYRDLFLRRAAARATKQPRDVRARYQEHEADDAHHEPRYRQSLFAVAGIHAAVHLQEAHAPKQLFAHALAVRLGDAARDAGESRPRPARARLRL